MGTLLSIKQLKEEWNTCPTGSLLAPKQLHREAYNGWEKQKDCFFYLPKIIN